MQIESSLPGDLEAILQMARDVKVFDAEEVLTVEELFQGYLEDPQKEWL